MATGLPADPTFNRSEALRSATRRKLTTSVGRLVAEVDLHHEVDAARKQLTIGRVMQRANTLVERSRVCSPQVV